jgi:hypothetical protein
MAEKITKPIVDAAKTTAIVIDEKIVKPTVGAVVAAPKTTVAVAKDVTKMTVEATMNAPQQVPSAGITTTHPPSGDNKD